MQDPVVETLDKAKNDLSKSSQLTENVTGNPTGSFVVTNIKKPNIPQAHQPSYNSAFKMRRT